MSLLLARPGRLLRPRTVLAAPRPLRFSYRVPLGGESPPLELSSGRLARMADGCGEARLGSTAVLTAVCRGRPQPAAFLPLTVDYRQKAAAAGRIPANVLRRELGPTTREILTSRLVDRSVRPLAPPGWQEEVGVTCNLLALDARYDPTVLAVNSTSLALALSSLPWQGAVGAVRLGWDGSRVLINPSRRQMSASRLDLIVVGSAQGRCTMLEGDAACLEPAIFLECIRAGLDECAIIATKIELLGKEWGKASRDWRERDWRERGDWAGGPAPQEMETQVAALTRGPLRNIFTDHRLDKQERDKRMFAVRDEVTTRFKVTHPQWEAARVTETWSKVCRHTVRDLIIDEGCRVDGRGLAEVRPISCQANLHSPLHGSALFQRGHTQVLCTVALDSIYAALKLDPMSSLTDGLKSKNFLLHYEFPSFATGEVGRGGAGANRRELGHGALAERALKAVVPAGRQQTVRLVCEVLESNGSSSMASVCGGSLALLDAGVPLTESVSGVAMGLVSRDAEHRVLTDIIGMEDYMGEMDFKMAASRSGVCAIQADVKNLGIDFDIIKQAVMGGVEANHGILDIMDRCIRWPADTKPCWPVSKQISVPASKRGKFLGPGGLNLKRIASETGVEVHAEEEGLWLLHAPSSAAMQEAEAMVKELIEEEKAPELVFGAIYSGRVVEVLESGVMLELHPGRSPILVPNKQLDARKVVHASALGLQVGQELQVKYFGQDSVTGQTRLSRKVLTVAATAAVKTLNSSAAVTRYDAAVDVGTADSKPGKSNNESHSSPPISLTQSPIPSERSNKEEKISKQVVDSKFWSPEMFPKLAELPTQSKTNSEIEEDEIPSEAQYYHIDQTLNQLMNLKIEVNDTLLKRNVVMSELDKVQVSLKLLKSGKMLLADAFLKETQEKHRSLLLRVKAIDESLSLLSRQYDDTRTKVTQEKKSFIETRSEKIEQKSFDPFKYITFRPHKLINRDSWTKADIVKNLESESESAEVKNESPLLDHPEENLMSHLVRQSSSLFALRPLFRLSQRMKQPIPAELLRMCQADHCHLCTTPLLSPALAQLHYTGLKHLKKCENYIMNNLYKSEKNFKKNFDRNELQRKLPKKSSLNRLRDDQEAEVREIAEKYSSTDVSLSYPWCSKECISFVNNSVKFYRELLKWLDDLENSSQWDEKTMKNVKFGLDRVHIVLVTQLAEIEKNYGHIEYFEDCVQFIEKYLQKPDQYMIKAAQNSLAKLKRLSDDVMVELSKDLVNPDGPGDVWKEFMEEKKKLESIKNKLWEFEAHEESVSELDDWKHEPGHFTNGILTELLTKIDGKCAEIERYTRADLTSRSSNIERDMLELQRLRVKTLLTWLRDQPPALRPHWLCEDLQSYIEDSARNYCSMDDTLVDESGWGGEQRGTDLRLDMAYSRMRTSVNKVKYGRIENRRHASELEVYKDWVDRHQTLLKRSTVDILEKLLSVAKDNVGVIDEMYPKYITCLLLEENKEEIRAKVEDIENHRRGKRKAIKEILNTISGEALKFRFNTNDCLD